MVEPPRDDRSPLAVGYSWSIRIMSIGIEMALPAVIGAWMDHKLGTVVLFVLLGAFLGMSIGFLHLLKIARNGK